MKRSEKVAFPRERPYKPHIIDDVLELLDVKQEDQPNLIYQLDKMAITGLNLLIFYLRKKKLDKRTRQGE